MKASNFSVRPKLFDYGDRSTQQSTFNQQYHDSFNTTTSSSNVTSDTGNTTVSIGEKSKADEWIDKLLPLVAITGLVLAGVTVLRRA